MRASRHMLVWTAFAAVLILLVDFAPQALTPLRQVPTRLLRGDAGLRTIQIDPTSGRELTSAGVFLNRVAGATQLHNGVIAVANRGNNEILFFDSLGQAVGSAGRKGAGPGEFNQIANVAHLLGDTVVVFDLQLRRISLLTPKGFVRDYPVKAPERANSPPSLGELYTGLDNGHLLIWLQTIPRNEADIRRWNEPYTVAQVPVVLFSIDRAGNTAKVFGEFPGDDKYLGNMSGTPVNMGPAPFGAWTRFAVAGGRVFVFRNTDPEIKVYNSAGQLSTVYRTAWKPRQITATDRRAYLAPRFAREARFRESLDKMPFPTTMPGYRSAFLSADGSVIWLEPYHLWDGKRRLLVGYDLSGAGIGKLSLAETDRILEIERESMLVLSVDSLGVETIRRNRFTFQR